MKPQPTQRYKGKWSKHFAFKPVRLRDGKLVWLRTVYSRIVSTMEYVEPPIYIKEYDLEENIIMEALTK